MNEIIVLLRKIKDDLTIVATDQSQSPLDDVGWTLWDVERVIQLLEELQRNK